MLPAVWSPPLVQGSPAAKYIKYDGQKHLLAKLHVPGGPLENLLYLTSPVLVNVVAGKLHVDLCVDLQSRIA